MSRIGKKPISLAGGVKYKVNGKSAEASFPENTPVLLTAPN